MLNISFIKTSPLKIGEVVDLPIKGSHIILISEIDKSKGLLTYKYGYNFSKKNVAHFSGDKQDSESNLFRIKIKP